MERPGNKIWIGPPQEHMAIALSFKTGRFLRRSVGFSGIQGAVVTGTQGMGVKTPAAATVAARTAGFAMFWHIAKGIIFSIGM
ncbi:hypothetical protein AGMMS49949_02040 [Alphaproteobacteria bacterium]|nr:hypothetical protein AGMMS49949_02040 [Alphaproteobacteria bacterium]GHS95884.1 hypothetical protein AGMMS50296_1300 [Alphaproteobacteria bacterium]